MDLALKDLQKFISHKTQTNKQFLPIQVTMLITHIHVCVSHNTMATDEGIWRSEFKSWTMLF